MHFSIFRYNPERDEKPYMQDFHVDLRPADRMLLDVILRIRDEQDDSLVIRKSCREGVCGSDAININGRNGLACVTPVHGLKEPVSLRPLPSFPVIRDLVVDMTRFFNQYHSIRPYLINDEPLPERERLQSRADRDKLDGSYECILCGCCTSQCPSSWWNPDCGPVAGLSLRRRQPGSDNPGAAGRPEQRYVPALPLPHDHELHGGLSEGPVSLSSDREAEASDDARRGRRRRAGIASSADDQVRPGELEPLR